MAYLEGSALNLMFPFRLFQYTHSYSISKKTELMLWEPVPKTFTKRPDAKDTAFYQLEMLTTRLPVECVPDITHYMYLYVAKTRGTPRSKRSEPHPVSPAKVAITSGLAPPQHNTLAATFSTSARCSHTPTFLNFESMARSPVLGMSRLLRPVLGQACAVSRLHTQSRTFMISRDASPSPSPKESTQHEKEDFYQYYLNYYKIHEQDLGRKLWPNSL